MPGHNKAARKGGDEVTHSINPMATVVNLWVQARFPRVKDGPKTGNHIDELNLATKKPPVKAAFKSLTHGRLAAIVRPQRGGRG